MRRLTCVLTCLIIGIGYLAAQTKASGVVISAEDKLPVIGASIVVKGTTIGTVTDFDGKFILDIPNGESKTLVISYVGLQSKEETAKQNMHIVLSSASQALDEVIVVAYGTAKKSSFTGSASNVKSESLSVPSVESVDKALSGKVSGVRVAATTGDPGSAGEIQVRGIGSISSSTSPLYVIDGVPVDNGNFNSRASSNILSSLNPNDIESLTVLKDAAAASLYGSRAANGVIIITTKRGKAGKVNVNLQANYGVSSMATNSYEIMSGTEYYDYSRTATINYYNDNGGISGFDSAEKYADAQMTKRGLTRTNGEDWRDYIYKHGMEQNYQLSVSGGSDKSKFYTSLGYQNIEGLARGTDFERYSGIINSNNEVAKWLDVDMKAQLSYTKQNGYRDQSSQAQGIGFGTPLGLLQQSNPTKPLKDKEGEYNQVLMGRGINPYYELNGKDKFLKTENYRALGNVNFTVKFTKDLQFRSTNGVDFNNAFINEYWGPNSIDGMNVGGMGQTDDYKVLTLTSSNIFQYTKTFNEKHNIDALAGYEAQKYNRRYTQAAVTNYSTDKLPDLSVGAPSRALGQTDNSFLQSFLSNVNYNFDNKYYLGANIRADRSSQLGADKRTGVFYSVSGSWRFSQESFLQGNELLTDGKLRASYGTNGRLPDSFYGHLALYKFDGIYGSNAAIYPYQPANKNLGWERSKNFNAGVDITLAERFAFTLEYFNKYTDNLIMEVPVSASTGFTTVLKNAGEISNRGMEFEFHGTDMLKSKVRWGADFSLSTLKATVEKLPGGTPMNMGDGDFYRYEEGKDLYSFYFPTYTGVNPETGKAEFLKDPSKPYSPDNVVNDASKAERSIVAKAYPSVTGALNNTLSYKGFGLNILLTYQFGGHLFNYPEYFMHNDGRRTGTNISKDVAGNYWTKPGDKVDNPRPSLASTGSDLFSSRYIKSTDFIRLKEIGFSYQLPSSLVSKMKLSNVVFNVSASNLCYLYAATKNMELEVPLNGYRTGDTPLARTVSFGVNVAF